MQTFESLQQTRVEEMVEGDMRSRPERSSRTRSTDNIVEWRYIYLLIKLLTFTQLLFFFTFIAIFFIISVIYYYYIYIFLLLIPEYYVRL